MTTKSGIDMVILGCGNRGHYIGSIVAENPGLGRVVAIAEPDAAKRTRTGEMCGVPAERRFATWREVLQQGKLGDLAVVTLMDREHIAAAPWAMELGYHLMLEKPMASTLEDCIAIDASRRKTKRIVAVCHGMRYHAVYTRIKEIIDSGVLGKIVSIDQLEGVDPQHQSHSFARGNWGNEARGSSMLLQKSCHDIDILCYLLGEAAVKVSSFGRLSHFRKENRPKGGPARCMDGCPIGEECPYNAVRLYRDGKTDFCSWIGIDVKTQEEREKFLRESNFGRCVYDLDNDVVDHQVVAMEFPSGATGTFTMTAFAKWTRMLRIHGDKGFLESNIEAFMIDVRYFWGAKYRDEHIQVPVQTGAHGGADKNILNRLVEAVRANDPSRVLTGTDESLRTHAVVFAAELARRTGKVVDVESLLKR